MPTLLNRHSRNYQTNGYELLKGLISPDISKRVLASIKSQIAPRRVKISQEINFPHVLDRAALDIYGPFLTPMKFFLWGLTPFMTAVTGKNLAPTYNFFRVYQLGDVCRVHSDRPACDHSMSLTLAYSNGVGWPFEVATYARSGCDEGDKRENVAITMEAGDAIIYRGVDVPHGRPTPNPNSWSAHMFIHWVDLDGPYADQAFEGEKFAEDVQFDFA